PPIFESAPFKGWQASRRSFVGHFDIESEGTLGLWIALVENLRHDLVAKIHRCAFNPRLLRHDQQAHKLWRTHGFAARVCPTRGSGRAGAGSVVYRRGEKPRP